MLVLTRLTPRGDLDDFCETIESEKRALYWEDVKPLYLLKQEGKDYVSVVLDIKNLDAIQKLFLKNLAVMAPVKTSKTIPIMSPIYFPLPKNLPKDQQRYQVYLRVAPEKYDDVYNAMFKLKYPKDVHLTYMSYSLGDDDIILSILVKDRESALKFVMDKIGKIDGVMAHDVCRVVKSTYLLPKDKSLEHKARFLYSAPAGQKGHLVNKKAHEEYLNEDAQMTVIVRLFAKKSLDKLWKDIEQQLPKFDSKHLRALYASQQEDKDYITVIFEASNFEVLKDVLTTNLPTLVDVRKTRTIPMLEPTYFLLPKSHPKDLDRYLITLRIDPTKAHLVMSKIISMKLPKNIFVSYATFSLGDDDILLSLLTETKDTMKALVKDVIGRIDGVDTYNISNQLRTKRLSSLKSWKEHQSKFLSSHDKQFKSEYDDDFDWTNDFHKYAAITGAFVHEFDE